jgi:toxin CcdB
MARLDVYPAPGENKRLYILDVQADLLSHLRTRTVVPLMRLADAPTPIGELNPVFEVDGEPRVMVTQAIGSIPAKELRRRIASADSHHDAVTRALDILLLGF